VLDGFDFESEDEVEEDEFADDEDVEEGDDSVDFDAGAVLDEEPRLSLR
jgi:hypothetical protein